MESPKRRKPGSWLIYPEIQLRLVGVNLAAVLLVGASALGGILLAARKLHDLGLKGNLPADHPFFRFLAIQNAAFLGTVAAVLAVSIVISVLATLLISHRIVGPIYRLREDMKEIVSYGKFRPVKIRKDDYFHEVVHLINSLQFLAQASRSRDTAKRPAQKRRRSIS